MKSKGKRNEPQTERGEPAPSQITHDDPHSRHSIHLAKQAYSVLSGKMVQHL
jgi:hypothetical protein